MNFLYWNFKSVNKLKTLRSVTDTYKPDIVILSECNILRHIILQTLNKTNPYYYRLTFNPIQDPIYFVNLPKQSFKTIHDGEGVSIREIDSPLGISFILVTVHLPSKMHYNSEDQHAFAIRTVRTIEEFENMSDHQNTIVVGDFNMNPFEPGLVGSESFHAVMSKDVAMKISRKVKGKHRKYFYNPMWSHFGDFPNKPPGTFYYNKSVPINYFWNMFDQVLIRPNLINHFEEENLEIITKAGDLNLATKSGRPNSIIGSDHFPIFFSIDEMKGVKNVRTKSVG